VLRFECCVDAVFCVFHFCEAKNLVALKKVMAGKRNFAALCLCGPKAYVIILRL